MPPRGPLAPRILAGIHTDTVSSAQAAALLLGGYPTVGYADRVSEVLSLPASAWHRAEIRDAAKARDYRALLRYAQQYTGASQPRLAAACGLSQPRVNEIINGRRSVTSLEVCERIAAGLSMPDEVRMLLGLAPIELHTAFPLASHGEVTTVYPSQSAAARDIRAAAIGADHIDVVAVRGLGILGMNDGLLRGPLSTGGPSTLRVLMLDPTSPAAHVRARQIGETPETFAATSQLALGRLRELTGIEVSVYQYRQRPVWRIFDMGGSIFVGTFDDLREGHHSPIFRLPKRVDGTLYRAFGNVVEQLLDDAVRVA